MPRIYASRSRHVWSRRKVVLDLSDGKACIKAWCLGPVTVHQFDDDAAIWVVSHTPTGLQLCLASTEAGARHIAEYLWESIPKVLVLATQEQAKAAVPRWVVEWLNKCREIRGWVDPPKQGADEGEIRLLMASAGVKSYDTI